MQLRTSVARNEPLHLHVWPEIVANDDFFFKFQDEEEVPPESGKDDKDEEGKEEAEKDEAAKEKQDDAEKSAGEEKNQEKTEEEAGSKAEAKVRS